MSHRSILACAAAAIAFASGAAHADVQYDFTAVSSYTVNKESITGSFTVVVPDFITADTIIPASLLTSCNATATKGRKSSPVDCAFEAFAPTYQDNSGSYDQLGFAVAPTVANPAGTRSVLYYFGDGAFGKFGSYETVVFGADQFGTLVVSQVGAVPEPATWLSMFVGLGLVGAARRWVSTQSA